MVKTQNTQKNIKQGLSRSCSPGTVLSSPEGAALVVSCIPFQRYSLQGKQMCVCRMEPIDSRKGRWPVKVKVRQWHGKTDPVFLP